MLPMKALLSKFFRTGQSQRRARAEALYAAIAAQARQPQAYRDHGVPDTLDGRFDSLCLHVFLVIRRLGREGPEETELARDIYDVLFADMDRALREMGVGDLGIARRVQQMAEALNGRIKAYGTALDAGDSAPELLASALRRNLYGTVDQPAPASIAAVARHVMDCDAALAGQTAVDLLKNGPAFAAWERR